MCKESNGLKMKNFPEVVINYLLPYRDNVCLGLRTGLLPVLSVL